MNDINPEPPNELSISMVKDSGNYACSATKDERESSRSDEQLVDIGKYIL